jgi:hypothetical protein
MSEKIAVRIPLPDSVQARIETEAHSRGVGSCIVLVYSRADEIPLAATLEQGREAIRRGPTV